MEGVIVYRGCFDKSMCESFDIDYSSCSFQVVINLCMLELLLSFVALDICAHLGVHKLFKINKTGRVE